MPTSKKNNTEPIPKRRYCYESHFSIRCKRSGQEGRTEGSFRRLCPQFSDPQGLAVAATTDNLNAFRLKEKAKAAQLERDKAAARENAQRLADVIVRISAKAGTGGRLFGSVTSREISEALEAQHGIIIEKNKIVLPENIKTYGAFDVKCKFGYEISGVIHVLVCEA